MAGCSTVPVTRIVHVKSLQFVPIPPALLAPCPKSDPKQIKTNGDLLNAYLADQDSLTICNSQLQQIKTLTPPSST